MLRGWAWLAVLVAACGYAPVYGGRAPSERLSVVAGPVRAPHQDAHQTALAAARAELERAGALRAGAGYPRVVVELLRVDERATAVAAVEADAPGSAVPEARTTEIVVVGRAWVETGAARVEGDTGDMSRVVRYAPGNTALQDGVRRDDALRAAARSLGRALARRVLGEPVPARGTTP